MGAALGRWKEGKGRRMEEIPVLNGQEAIRAFSLQEGEKQGSRVVRSVVSGSQTDMNPSSAMLQQCDILNLFYKMQE